MRPSKRSRSTATLSMVLSAMLAAALGVSGCASVTSGSGGSGGNAGTGGAAGGGAGGTGGTGGAGGAGGAGGTGGEEPPPPPRPTGVVIDSGGGTIKSDQYQMDVSVGGPVGKGKADSPLHMLDYYIPTSPQR